MYSLNDYLVLKVDHGERRGDSQYNENELRFWESVKNTPLHTYFFPVVEYQRGRLVMEKAPKVAEYIDETKIPNYKAFRTVVKYMRLTDVGGRNCGIREDGMIALLDYGFQRAASQAQIDETLKELEKIGAI